LCASQCVDFQHVKVLIFSRVKLKCTVVYPTGCWRKESCLTGRSILRFRVSINNFKPLIGQNERLSKTRSNTNPFLKGRAGVFHCSSTPQYPRRPYCRRAGASDQRCNSSVSSPSPICPLLLPLVPFQLFLMFFVELLWSGA
jgi:hypothetical protein